MTLHVCNHDEYTAKHCVVMTCWNYINRCPKHSPAGVYMTGKCIHNEEPEAIVKPKHEQFG